MLQKIKKLGAVLLILVLLPYIVTLLFQRDNIGTTQEKSAQQQLLEKYCIGVLASEVSQDYENEILKAQAVMVRTTIYSKLNELDAEKVESEIRAQPKLERKWKERLEAAWQETEGQVVMYGENLALVPFHQLSNGKTRSGAEVLGEDTYPYLQVVECPKDIGADAQMQTKVISVSGASVTKRDSANYVQEVKVGEEVGSGESFREKYKLASSCFELQEFDGKTRVVTRGVGHGLGLSQFTANEMAKEGKTYRQILEYFFPQTEIKEVAEILWETE